MLSEFESQILYYRDLQLEINSEPECINVGALALFTGYIKKNFLLTAQQLTNKMTKSFVFFSTSGSEAVSHC